MNPSKHPQRGGKSSEMLPLKVIVGMSLQLGFAVATTTVLFVYGGHYLDERFGKNYFFWIGLVVGLVASLYLVWKIVKPLQAIARGEEKVKSNS